MHVGNPTSYGDQNDNQDLGELSHLVPWSLVPSVLWGGGCRLVDMSDKQPQCRGGLAESVRHDATEPTGAAWARMLICFCPPSRLSSPISRELKTVQAMLNLALLGQGQLEKSNLKIVFVSSAAIHLSVRRYYCYQQLAGKAQNHGAGKQWLCTGALNSHR